MSSIHLPFLHISIKMWCFLTHTKSLNIGSIEHYCTMFLELHFIFLIIWLTFLLNTKKSNTGCIRPIQLLWNVKHILIQFNDCQIQYVRKTHFPFSDKDVTIYNLEVVIAIEYRVKSKRVMMFILSHLQKYNIHYIIY